MGKSAAAILANANKLADEKAKLSKRNMLSVANKEKIDASIEKSVTSAIKVMNRRPKKANNSQTSRSLSISRTVVFR